MSLKAALRNKENWIFAGAQMGAGVLNYGFQILASQQLSATEFGQWSGWFAHFSFFLFVTIWVQSLMTLQGTLPFRFSAMTAWASTAALGGVSLFSINVGLEVYAGWAWMLLFSIFFGLSLSHRLLIAAAAGSVIISVAKFGIVALFPTYDGYRWAVLFGPALACLMFLIYYPQMQKKTTAPKSLHPNVLLSALFLSVATALIPQLDLLAAQSILTLEELGGFAKVALLYKGIFFLLMILAQVLVTYQIRGAQVRISLLNLGSLYVLGALVAFIIPYLGFLAYLPSVWMTGATIHIISLSLVFFLTQQESAGQRWAWPALWTGILAVEYALARWTDLGLTNYWIAAVGVELVSVVIFLFVSRRERASAETVLQAE